MERVYLLLGTNVGDRSENLAFARKSLAEQGGRIGQASAIYETAPWGQTDQPAFFNQALGLDTDLVPEALLATTMRIEQALGRVRTADNRWGPRTLDIDMLLFGDQVVETPTLSVPHPRLTERRFALLPLAEIAPEAVHPLAGLTIVDLLAQCPDPLPVQKTASVAL